MTSFLKKGDTGRMRRVKKVLAAVVGLVIAFSIFPPHNFAQNEALKLEKIQLSVKGNRRSVLFQFTRPPESVKSFALTSPSRLVVDVAGAPEGFQASTFEADDELLNQIRIGVHPNYLRLVLDLKEAKAPFFTVEQRKNRVAVVFARENIARMNSYSQMLFTREEPTPAETGKESVRLARQSESPAHILPRPSIRQTAPATATRDNTKTRERETPKSPAQIPSATVLSSQAVAHLEQGQEFYDEGELDKAIFEWRETVRLAPENAKAHHLLGLALGDYGDRTEAIRLLEKSLLLDPENAMARVHLARTLEAEGRKQNAVLAYRKALELVPTSAYIHDRLGHLLAAEGNTAGAAEEWQRAIDLDPEYAYTHANLGEALESLGSKRSALKAYQRAIELDPHASFAKEVKKRIAQLTASGL